ncbi:MAG: hypothetical protein ABMB14_41100 [Myxococcota bacterium]
MIWLLSHALAAMPPEVNLEDLGPWEDNAERLLDLPDGCWEWVGEAKWDWDVGRWGGSRGDAVFAGQTAEGTWGDVALSPMGELRREKGDLVAVRVYDAKEARFAPLVGKFRGARVTVSGGLGRNKTEADLAENAEAANVLREALARVSGDAYSSYAEWDDGRGGVVLHRAVSLAPRDSQQIDFQVFFPRGGTLPTQLDLRFPDTFRTGKLPRWTIREAEVHVRGAIKGDEVFPTSEAFTFGFGILGFRFHGAQTVRYRRVTRCYIPQGPLLEPVPGPAAAPVPEPAIDVEAVEPPAPPPEPPADGGAPPPITE